MLLYFLCAHIISSDFLVKYDPVMFWSGFRIHPTRLTATDRRALDLSWCSWKLLCSLFVMKTESLRAALVCNIVSWCYKASRSHFYYQQQICLSVAFLAKTKSPHVLASTWEQKEDGCWDFPVFLWLFLWCSTFCTVLRCFSGWIFSVGGVDSSSERVSGGP